MDRETLRYELEKVVLHHGPWTAHNVCLADGVYTMSPDPQGDEVKLRRIVQLVSDLSGGRFEGLRVLDLACLEGMYALELAARGAEVVAIEGREGNIAKAKFAAGALGLDIDFQLGDVRSLSRERHGEFDIVLCLGILYHLDGDDVVRMVEQIRSVAKNAAIFDTSVAAAGDEVRSFGDLILNGTTLVEHRAGDSVETKLARVWSSLDNDTAFLPTLPSLVRLLGRSGFPTVLEAYLPTEPAKPATRHTLVALVREPVTPLLAPMHSAMDEAPETRSEGKRPGPNPLRRLAHTVRR